MRSLTLNEKINIKADLARYGIPLQELTMLDMRSAMFFGSICHQNPAVHFCRLNATKTDLSGLRHRVST